MGPAGARGTGRATGHGARFAPDLSPWRGERTGELKLCFSAWRLDEDFLNHRPGRSSLSAFAVGFLGLADRAEQAVLKLALGDGLVRDGDEAQP